MTDSEDPEVAAMRERAERVMAKRAAARAEAGASTNADAAPPKKKGRRWYHWVIDAALLAMLAYVVKVRFFPGKGPEAPANAPAQATSGSASASAAPASSGVPTRASAELRLGPGPLYAVAETLPPNTVVEVLGQPSAGWIQVRVVSSGKTGWLPIETFSAPH